jgi:hypothetical protein
MKKTLLFAAAAITAGTLSAQVTVTSAHVAPMGSVIPQANDTMPNALDAGSAGANQTWNYTALNEHELDVLTFTNPDWTSNGADFPGSNLAATLTTVDGDMYIYLNKTASGLHIVGQAVDFLGTGAPASVPNDPDQVLINFPANYQDTYSGTSAFDITLDGSPFGIDSVRLKNSTDRTYEIDAWGSITTPIGTYDALRLNSTDVSTDSTWGMIAGMWQFFDSGVETSYSFDWWTADASVGFPIVSMEADMNGNALSVTYLKTLPTVTGLAEGIDGSKVSVYPNPTSNYVNFVIESDNASIIEVYDVTGKLIDAQQIERLATTFDMSNSSAGMYMYILKDASGNMLHNGKFSVVK